MICFDIPKGLWYLLLFLVLGIDTDDFWLLVDEEEHEGHGDQLGVLVEHTSADNIHRLGVFPNPNKNMKTRRETSKLG